MKTFVIGLLGLVALQAMGENWPAWRGPRGDGTSLEKSAPTQWSATNNIVWKTEIPGAGHSSPVIWNDRVFTATALPDKQERALVCLDRKTGKLVWQQPVLTARLEAKNGENSYASCTPATDGEKVYVCFQDGDQIAIAAHDFSGKQLWLVRVGEFQNDHGFASSTILYEDKVIVSAQGKKGNFLVAVSRADGRTLWKIQLDNASNSFGQPLVRSLAGRPQIVLCGNQAATSFDPKDGARIWFVEYDSSDLVVTPVYNEKAGLVLVSSSWPKKELKAIKPDGQGDVTKTKVAWQTTTGAPYVPSGISVGDFFLTVSDANSDIYCYEAATGKIVWHEKLGRTHASPVSVNGLAYFLNDAGVTKVVKIGEKCEIVATNDLGEKCFASPAVSEGQIFLRSFNRLYCIGQ